MKIATMEDFPEIKEMIFKFADTTYFKDIYSPSVIEDLISHVLTGDPTKMIVILEEGVGMIAGITSKFIYGDFLVANELAWWVNEDQRKNSKGTDLLDAFEYWAINKAGCKLVAMSSLDDSVGKIYEKKGYSLYDRTYSKLF